MILSPQFGSSNKSRSHRGTLGKRRLRNCLIREPLAFAAHDGACGALLIGNAKRLMGIIPEVEFLDVAAQALLIALLLSATLDKPCHADGLLELANR